jgi:hypothetical protein
MTSQKKDFPIRKETLEQLAQKQIEEINEQLNHSTGQSSPKDDPGLPLNQTTAADLFSDIPPEQS